VPEERSSGEDRCLIGATTESSQFPRNAGAGAGTSRVHFLIRDLEVVAIVGRTPARAEYFLNNICAYMYGRSKKKNSNSLLASLSLESSRKSQTCAPINWRPPMNLLRLFLLSYFIYSCNVMLLRATYHDSCLVHSTISIILYSSLLCVTHMYAISRILTYSSRSIKPGSKYNVSFGSRVLTFLGKVVFV